MGTRKAISLDTSAVMNLLCSIQRNVFMEKLEKRTAVCNIQTLLPVLLAAEDFDSITSENVMKHLSYGAHICHHLLKTFQDSVQCRDIKRLKRKGKRIKGKERPMTVSLNRDLNPKTVKNPRNSVHSPS